VFPTTAFFSASDGIIAIDGIFIFVINRIFMIAINRTFILQSTEGLFV
jgi:hypothetical protein